MVGNVIVGRIMLKQPTVVGPRTSIRAVAALMQDRSIGLLPVVDEGRVIGVVTDRDLVVRLLSDAFWDTHCPISAVMTKNPIMIRPDQSVLDAVRIMGDRQVRRLLVGDGDGNLAGVLSLGDIAREASEELAGQALGEIVEWR